MLKLKKKNSGAKCLIPKYVSCNLCFLNCVSVWGRGITSISPSPNLDWWWISEEEICLYKSSWICVPLTFHYITDRDRIAIYRVFKLWRYAHTCKSQPASIHVQRLRRIPAAPHNENPTFLPHNMVSCWSQWPRGLRRRSATAHLLRLWVRILPGAWIYVCCGCCVLSGRGLCDGLIARPEESYWVWTWSLGTEEALAHWGL